MQSIKNKEIQVWGINKYESPMEKNGNYKIKVLTISLKTPTSTINVNTVLLIGKNTAIIFDPSIPVDIIKENLEGKNVEAIILTHSHWDHVLSLCDCIKAFDCPVYLNKNSQRKFLDAHINCSDTHNLNLIFNMPKDARFIEFKDERGDLKLKDFDIKYIHTPGHSDDSMSYILDNNLICGDSLRMKKIARTNLPKSDINELIKTTNFYKKLDKNTMVYNGHDKPDFIKNSFQINANFNELEK